MMFIHIIVLIALLLTNNLFALAKKEKISDFKKDKILIDAWFDKEEYLVGEDITINIRFINISNKKFLLPNPRDLSSFYRDFRNTDGCELGDQFSGFYQGPEIITIAPHDTIEINTHINEPYKTLDTFGIYHDIPANKYTYHMKYLDRYWKKTKSYEFWEKILNFTIKEPSGSDHEAYQLYSKANRYLFSIKGARNKKAGIELLNKIIEDHPNSVYVPLAMDSKIEALCLRSSFYTHYTDSSINYCKQLIEKYPDFRTGDYLGIIQTVYYRKGKSEEFKVYLNNVMINTTNKELKNKIKKHLDLLKSQESEARKKYNKGEHRRPVTNDK